MLKIVYFQNPETAEIPVMEFIDKLKPEAQKIKILSHLNYVAANNGFTDDHIAKTIRGEKFMEIRIKMSKNLYRIMYYVIKKRKTFTVLHFQQKRRTNNLT